MMKLAVSELSPWTFRSVCVAISGGGLLLLANLSGDSLRVPRSQWPALLVVALLSVTGWHLFSAFSLVHMEGGRGAIVAYTMPIWAAILSAWYLKERMSRRRLASLVLGMLGIAFLIGPDLLGLGRDPARPAADDRCRNLLGRGHRGTQGPALAGRHHGAHRLAAASWAERRSSSPG